MFIMMRNMVVTEEGVEQVINKFGIDGIIEEQEGFIDLSVMEKKSRSDEKEVIVMIRWETEEHWKQWEKSDAHIAGHKANRGKPKPDYIISSDAGLYRVRK
ncbi:antibiotic biosynthesis monooxygenase [Oceanobacillus sp. 143]|uniref:Antibiotic biosynthesis monooxygenase n=1 Tax=Oceanobacillus zhaokaii TaxID=2052660 RepID=A0A345PDQ7_9BACI|nr:antibiotic biosynthesis monooxygenase [Oceanobacillus zhaokaii]AXI08137.1 antibiotic biosynthesis monooxygenase [Oceanobacillus zhaokaii]QGS69863.1 antibiotic biosynthesis monooxygenase [Oceanobacillus sp. 143]